MDGTEVGFSTLSIRHDPGMKVMRTDLYLRELAQRCRYWSRYTFDLTAAREFRELAQELETKAREAQRSELPDQAPRRKE